LSDPRPSSWVHGTASGQDTGDIQRHRACSRGITCYGGGLVVKAIRVFLLIIMMIMMIMDQDQPEYRYLHHTGGAGDQEHSHVAEPRRSHSETRSPSTEFLPSP
jgi:hypothetical protein